MRLLFVNRMLGIAWGGGENYDFQLASALAELGADVTFLGGRAAGRKETDPLLPITAVGTEWVQSPYWRHWMYRLGGRIPYLPGAIAEADLHLFQRAALRRIEEMLASRRIDIVQILGLPALARQLSERGVPVALRFPGPPAWFLRGPLRNLADRRRVVIFSHGDTVRFLNEHWKISVREIPPGVRQDIFHPLTATERVAARARRGWSTDELIVVCAGRLVPGKGQEFVVRAFARHLTANRNSRLVIAGDGPLRARLEHLVARLAIGDRVEFSGHCERTELARLMGAADVFSLCSDYENYSNAVIEAMASGLPVIATRLGGFAMQVVPGRTGFLVERGNIQEYCDCLSALAALPELRREMGQRAIEFAAAFSWQRSAAEALRLYDKLLQN
jgi:glycosyltransferase involved in cell wall biosynthesis